MENTPKEYAHIPGWGIDADPKNDPTYPMRNRANDEHEGYNWERPSQQPTDIEVLKSIERPNTSAVFGTSVPPSGLSGAIRRLAFKQSESEYGHWLPLILADRVNVIEGIIDDLKRGHIPNIFAEKGMKADWKYDKKGLVQTIVITAVVVTGVVAFFGRSNKPKKRRR
ncbi:hypothetical protein [Spirosoma areae]